MLFLQLEDCDDRLVAVAFVIRVMIHKLLFSLRKKNGAAFHSVSQIVVIYPTRPSRFRHKENRRTFETKPLRCFCCCYHSKWMMRPSVRSEAALYRNDWLDINRSVEISTNSHPPPRVQALS